VTVHKSREEEREEKQQECLTIGLDREDPVVTGSLVKFCARAATGGGAVATPVELPVAGSASLIGRDSWWGAGSGVNLVTLTTGPHLLFIALRDGGPPATSLSWTSPIRT
jgi:hypothetical protein